jgi:hypothetical protein
VCGQKDNRNTKVSADRGGSRNTADLAIQLNVHEDKIGVIALGSAERIGGSAGIPGNLVAELYDVAFKR